MEKKGERNSRNDALNGMFTGRKKAVLFVKCSERKLERPVL